MLRFAEIINPLRCLTFTDRQRTWASKYQPVFLLQNIVQVGGNSLQISSEVG